MKRASLLALGAALYIVAAWLVAPGFYDGFGPPQPYNFTCPPPQAGANLPPSSGHVDIKVIGGVSDANSAFTDDGQLVIGFLPGAFAANGATTITVNIKPLGSCPSPPGIMFVTNVYDIVATQPLTKSAVLDMRYSNLLPDPSTVYFATDPGGPWKSIAVTNQAQPYVITSSTQQFGYFAAGYPSASPPPGSITVGGGQTLPIVVAVIIVVVLVAGSPIAILRRRQSRHGVEDDDE